MTTRQIFFVENIEKIIHFLISFFSFFDSPGTYYPAVSLYFGATVRLNPGPEFRFFPEKEKIPSLTGVCSLVLPVPPEKSAEGEIAQQELQQGGQIAEGVLPC